MSSSPHWFSWRLPSFSAYHQLHAISVALPLLHTLPLLRYSDISGLRREKDWRGAHWVAVTSPLLPDGKPLWLGVGSSEALAVELLSAISAQGR
jgi:hypothetical protein